MSKNIILLKGSTNRRGQRFLTMLFNDGDVDQTFSNLSDAQWYVHGLYQKLFFVVIFIFDEERHVNVHGLHVLLELYGSCRL